MLVYLQQRFVRFLEVAHLSIIPAMAGAILVIAGILPWLDDPLGGHASAWKLPLDVGWQFRNSMINYGLFCCCCALFTFFVAYIHWHAARKGEHVVYGHILYVLAGLLCLAPIALFFFQYIFADIKSINNLVQHEIQARLIIQHFGYSVSKQRLPMKPFNLDISTLQGRFALIFDHFSYGLLLPPIGSWILLDYKRLAQVKPIIRELSVNERKVKCWWLIGSLSLSLVGLGILGRAPAAYMSEYYAKTLLLTGNYSQALVWLNRAHTLNPALDELSYYHVDRGQALYYLYPDQVSDESRLYLAFTYRSQEKTKDAYLQLIPVMTEKRAPRWVINDMSLTLEKLATIPSPTSLEEVQGSGSDALPWLKLLNQVDPSNVYAYYAIGHSDYALHYYDRTIAEMQEVFQLSTSPEIRSSALTYLGLSEGRLGHERSARACLVRAIALDPNYYNNTAREQLSGLH